MSVFLDLSVRTALSNHLITIGNQSGSVGGERMLDLSVFNISPFQQAEIQIVEGEGGAAPLKEDKEWVEPFLIKNPQRIISGQSCGLSQKLYQYAIWVKTDRAQGVRFNEMVSGLLENHFPNNTHLPIQGGSVLTVLKTYQQATISPDPSSGRLFNRVFVDCENYYKNNN